ncbi:glycosyltransferase family 2 protein [Terrimonas pollutisoli]|uniref:glycosyltransferase family 2 protein n=1 Tax=Terrimonas pollutisoli TaxID=3034147 RepID=UPI0023EA8D8A|nr:glycosyltransferase family 2 protein [Terrimonas sp. H1YJ31]
MKAPFFSIVIATFNAEQTLEKTLRSIINQRFKDFELLIIDGRSTDQTMHILRQFSAGDSRIKILSEPDAGVYDALNKGIRLAEGQWLYFLGADDFFYADDVLEKLQIVMKNTTASIVYGNVWYEQYGRFYDGKFTISKLLTRNICHQAVFYKSGVFAEIGIYNLLYKTEADYDFNLRCWLRGARTQFVPVTIAFYTSGGLSGSSRDSALVDDYPYIASAYLLNGNLSKISIIANLAHLFRKILLRYPFKKMRTVIWRGGHYAKKIIACFWMLLTLPFYFLISIIHRQE